MDQFNIPRIDAYNEESARILIEGWKGHIEAVRSVMDGFSDEQAVKLAVLLENTRQGLLRAEHLNETTQATDIGPFKKYAFDILTAVMPSLIAEELVSVQPLKQKIGQVFFLKYLYGSTKGGVSAGDTMFSPLVVGPEGYNGRNYSSEYVEDEVVGESGADHYVGNLSYVPLRPGTVVFKIGATKYKDDGNGAIIPYAGGSPLASSSINYSTGAYELTLSGAAGDDVFADYQFDLEFAPSTIPEVTLKVEEQLITARSRKLKALYAFDAAYDLKVSQGVDMDAALLEAVSTEIKHEIDGEIMYNLLAQAGLSTTWDRTPPSDQISWIDHKQAFLDHLTAASNMIFQATRRAVGNYIVCGKQASDIIESFGAPRWAPAAPGTRKSGPHLAGVLDGKWNVYKNPYYAETAYLVGYKGDTLLDAGYVYAPYLPIFATQLLMKEDFVGRRGFATSYGVRMLNSNLYVKGTITQS